MAPDLFQPIVGGALIGLSAVMLMALNGRIAGISGILNNAVSRRADGRGWRLAFLAGALMAGWSFVMLTGEPLVTRADMQLPLLLAAGFLVGYGTRIARGCTSGHGVCGIARLSMRSLVATLVFLGVGMATASLLGLAGFLS